MGSLLDLSKLWENEIDASQSCKFSAVILRVLKKILVAKFWSVASQFSIDDWLAIVYARENSKRMNHQIEVVNRNQNKHFTRAASLNALNAEDLFNSALTLGPIAVTHAVTTVFQERDADSLFLRCDLECIVTAHNERSGTLLHKWSQPAPHLPALWISRKIHPHF